MLDLLVVADDLSGAAESGAAALLRTSRTLVALDPTFAAGPGHRVVTIDTDSRGSSADDAGRRVALVGAAARDATLVVKKVDSLLRGPLRAELDALAFALDAPCIVATALPSQGRTVVDGAVLVDGKPLGESGSWSAEADATPRGIGDLLVAGRAETVDLDIVRAAPSVLRAALRRIVEADRVPVCDGLTTDDLRAVRDAALAAWARPLFVGSGALVGVVAELLTVDDDLTTADEHVSPATLLPDGSLVVVLGTASAAAHRQLAHLEAALGTRADVVRCRPQDLLADPGAVRDRLGRRAAHPITVVAIDSDDVGPSEANRLTAALAHATEALVGAAPTVVLAGGATARRVLDDQSVRTLQPVRLLSGGAVLSRSDTGQLVVTRPGSHGDDESLARLVHELSPPDPTPHTDPHTDTPYDSEEPS